MRFAFLISLMTAATLVLPLSAIAQSIDLKEAVAQNFEPQMVKGKQVAQLKAGEGFALSSLGGGFGNISALTHDTAGNIYIADQDTGRIWRLTDRNQDSRVDSKRALPHRFDAPTGLAAYGGKLYVADRNAIWVMAGIQPPQILARLREADSIGFPHPLAMSPNGEDLFLAIKTKSGDIKILSIDTDTGTASLTDTASTDQTAQALVSVGTSSPWVALDHSVGANLNQTTQFDPTHRLKDIAVPPPELNWPESMSGRIFASRQSAIGYDIIAIPAAFGQPSHQADVLLSGFLSASGRTAWGAPSALSFDRYGLIFADSYNGDIYRISANIEIEPVKDPLLSSVIEEETQTSGGTKPGPAEIIVSTITGSQIGKASTLDSASGLDVGSTIIRDYKPLSLKEDIEGENKSDKKTKE